MLRWKGRDHSPLRTGLALLLPLPLVMLWGLALGRHAPLGLDGAFAMAFLGAFLGPPVVGLGLLLLPGDRRRLLGVVALAAAPALLLWLL